ncbi:MAG: hypothetical protein QGG50_01310 [Methanopyri archaeon]|nr:hypothetical protein [Methanopyri archaeon]|tara:strand:+ start:218 stop:1129 length:912 start_codon:yes stop_codon:yes gene_type:complete
MTNVEEELEVLSTHLTELSKLCRRRFAELSPKKDVLDAREELDTLRGHVTDIEKRMFQRMERVEGMKVVDEVERLVELTERSDDLRQQIKSEVRRVELLAGEMEKFTRDRTFLEDTIGKVVDLATTVERSSSAVDRHLKEMNDGVLALQKSGMTLEGRIRNLEESPGPHEEHIIELETRLKLLEELTERLEHVSGDRSSELKAGMVALKSRVGKLEETMTSIDGRVNDRLHDWEETMRKEFALLDGRIINIEKSLVRRLEQVERLEKQQEQHLESMDDLLTTVQEALGRNEELAKKDLALTLE